MKSLIPGWKIKKQLIGKNNRLKNSYENEIKLNDGIISFPDLLQAPLLTAESSGNPGGSCAI
jgi:hypothetical protein